MNKTIDLENFRTQLGAVKSRVFTGRDRGEVVRDKSNIDKIFDTCDKITIIIPKDVYSITPSFLEEFFVNIVKKYGKKTFLSKIQWVDNGYDISSQLDEAIERILRKKTGLD
ncbi:STAS-like domain-containing protein [Caecibacteroides pullorum]|uniref:DUF4325 domain-containing protein n=1 Tax=Caecibacteroides pullorum TaxID=2725562 RepID=A0AA40ZRI1_9BACT|nr:DUF4325 domain-containing protein [Caecibacteroides pullorum]MBM6856618.1 DUF4325 domain-containing protein [Caecibacteroides pullorum]MBV8057624.1 STAS-like domain-containing protein [Caecibacteroides pullorum]